MKLFIEDPPHGERDPTRGDAINAVRHAFEACLDRGQTVVHRLQLNHAIDNWLIMHQINPINKDSAQAFDTRDFIEEVLGTGRYSTWSFERATLVTKGGPWYCPHPARAIVLDESESETSYTVLSPLPAKRIASNTALQPSPRLDQGGLAYVCTLPSSQEPWPIVDPFDAIRLERVDVTAPLNERALHFLRCEVGKVMGDSVTGSLVSALDISNYDRREVDRRVQIRSVGRWHPPFRILDSRPPDLWGAVRIGRTEYLIAAKSTLGFGDDVDIRARRALLLVRERSSGSTPNRQIYHIRTEPFLATRIDWAMDAALGSPVEVRVSERTDKWVGLEFTKKHDKTVLAGPLLTWLALIGRPSKSQNGVVRWRIHPAAERITREILAEYFALQHEE